MIRFAALAIALSIASVSVGAQERRTQASRWASLKVDERQWYVLAFGEGAISALRLHDLVVNSVKGRLAPEDSIVAGFLTLSHEDLESSRQAYEAIYKSPDAVTDVVQWFYDDAANACLDFDVVVLLAARRLIGTPKEELERVTEMFRARARCR